ncbi:MAG: hypothetical protein RSF93_06410, partial [Mucinivorans sp.]
YLPEKIDSREKDRLFFWEKEIIKSALGLFFSVTLPNLSLAIPLFTPRRLCLIILTESSIFQKKSKVFYENQFSQFAA